MSITISVKPLGVGVHLAVVGGMIAVENRSA
jgi:hypothetical protein